MRKHGLKALRRQFIVEMLLVNCRKQTAFPSVPYLIMPSVVNRVFRIVNGEAIEEDL